MFYKIIKNTTFIGVGNSNDLRRWQPKHQIILVCDENKAEYIQVGDLLYHDDWMLWPKNDILVSQNAAVIQISREEYDALVSVEEHEIEPEQEPVDEQSGEFVDPVEETTLEYAVNKKVAELSKVCNQVIEAGFEMICDDGEIHHFTLNTQDQLNLITLSTQVAAGMTAIPYHSDGELCRFFSVNEVTQLLQKATEHKTYHVTYFNVLKNYVKHLNNIEDVAAVYYGMEIPEEYMSDVMKYLIQNNTGINGVE